MNSRARAGAPAAWFPTFPHRVAQASVRRAIRQPRLLIALEADDAATRPFTNGALELHSSADDGRSSRVASRGDHRRLGEHVQPSHASHRNCDP